MSLTIYSDDAAVVELVCECHVSSHSVWSFILRSQIFCDNTINKKPRNYFIVHTDLIKFLSFFEYYANTMLVNTKHWTV